MLLEYLPPCKLPRKRAIIRSMRQLDDPQTIEAQIVRVLEDAGHRLTEPRLQLIRAVADQSERPFTGEALYDELKKTGLGRATVFRTLKLLQDLGVLSRLHLFDGCQHYIVTPHDLHRDQSHQDRLICRQCGRVTYLDDCPMSESIARIAEQSGYHIESHHLDILGLCGNCVETPNSDQE